MKTLLFIHGGKVVDETPSQRLVLRLNWAIDYHNNNIEKEEIIFLISGRCGNVTEDYILTEAEIGKRYILQRIPDAIVIKEDISTETIGNYAFSKPLITSINPDKVIIITSDIMKKRIEFLANKLLGDSFNYEFHFIEDELSGNKNLLEREVKSIKMLQKLMKDIPDKDDEKTRNVLLYKTPYYFKGVIDDKAFFDQYWDGGFDDFIAKRALRH